MSADKAGGDPVTGEIRIKSDGGLAYFPGRTREQVLSLGDLPPTAVQEIVDLADASRFFDRSDVESLYRPDARTYTLCLTIGARTHQLRIAEPVSDVPLAKLLSKCRRLAQRPADRGL
jgi:hypothetical protein